MYKVVIIDDEPIIVEGLSRSINWKDAQCQVVGMAYSGEEGLKLIRREKPDIIFSDIRMPYMDGLTMIAAIKSEFPNTQITILTGYRDFDYAQRAIKLGVTRFLLKPSKMDELEEALRAMRQKLEETEERRQENEEKPAGEEVLPEKGEDKEGSEDGAVDSTANNYIVKNAVNYIAQMPLAHIYLIRHI